MTEDKTYNGYTNYLTWKLCLNLDNDQSLYNRFHNYKGTADELREELEQDFEFHDVGYKICDFWSYAEWTEIDWQEVLETRKDEDD
jgi:hypothetical protein